MDAALRSGATSHDFFRRARARLTLDVPAALDDPTVEATRGDLDLDPAMWEQAGVKATRPAAVLIPVIEPILNPAWVMLFVHETPSRWALILDYPFRIVAEGRSIGRTSCRKPFVAHN